MGFHGFPWVSHGFPIGFPWVSHGFPVYFPKPRVGLSTGGEVAGVQMGLGGCPGVGAWCPYIP